MSAEEPKTDTARRWSNPWLSALAFFLVYLGISLGIHWITGNGFPPGFITGKLVGAAIATAVYAALMAWLTRRRAGRRRR